MAQEQVRTLFFWAAVLLATLALVGVHQGFDYFKCDTNCTFTSNQWQFLLLTLMAVILWTGQLTPAFVPGMLVILVSLLLDLVPKDILLSGFHSDVFFLVLAVFVLSALLSASGLTTRVALTLLSWLPKARLTAPLILLALGLMLTLIIPSPLGRAAIITPLLKAFMADEKGYENLPLVSAAIHGNTLLSTVFLTGNPLNFVLLGLFDAQTQQRFAWIDWFWAASMLGVLVLLGYSLLLLVQLKVSGAKPLPAELVEQQRRQLGPMTARERGAIWALLMFVLVVLTQDWHQVPLVWASFAIALGCFALTGLSAMEFRTHIDWPTLFFIASIVCWGPALSYLGIDVWVSQVLLALLQPFVDQSWQLILVLSAIIVVIRLAFPGAPTFIILISALLPFADAQGINPWMLGFVLLTVSESFVFPHQHGVYEQTQSELKAVDRGASLAGTGLMYSNLWVLLIKLLALLACIPIWQAMAIL